MPGREPIVAGCGRDPVAGHQRGVPVGYQARSRVIRIRSSTG